VLTIHASRRDTNDSRGTKYSRLKVSAKNDAGSRCFEILVVIVKAILAAVVVPVLKCYYQERAGWT
jgi:hypothetical protein